eukprot:414657-Prymnesium_polylepis.1
MLSQCLADAMPNVACISPKCRAQSDSSNPLCAPPYTRRTHGRTGSSDRLSDHPLLRCLLRPKLYMGAPVHAVRASPTRAPSGLLARLLSQLDPHRVARERARTRVDLREAQPWPAQELLRPRGTGRVVAVVARHEGGEAGGRRRRAVIELRPQHEEGRLPRARGGARGAAGRATLQPNR